MNSAFRVGYFMALLLSVTIARGDIAIDRPPRPVVEPAATPGITVPVEVVYANANGNPAARIAIPLETLKALAAVGQINKSYTVPVVSTLETSEPISGFPHGGTIIAGLALSLAIVSMVYLLRRKPQNKSGAKWAITGAAMLLVGLGVTSYLWADIAIPGQPYRGPARRPIPNPPAAAPMVTIEIVEKGDKIVITVPPLPQPALPVPQPGSAAPQSAPPPR